MQLQELQNIAGMIESGRQDPDYLAFCKDPLGTPIPPDRIKRYIEIREKEKSFPLSKLNKLIEEAEEVEWERERDEEARALEFCRRPSSKLATQYFRARLDSPFFGRWKNAYAKVVGPEHMELVEKVCRERPSPSLFPFHYDDDAPEVKRYYPKRRKTRNVFLENRLKVANYARENNNASNEEIAEALGIAAATVKRCLQSLRDEGYIRTMTVRRVGIKNGAGEYMWVNNRTISFVKPLPDTL